MEPTVTVRDKKNRKKRKMKRNRTICINYLSRLFILVVKLKRRMKQNQIQRENKCAESI